jgi:hypothetical protein
LEAGAGTLPPVGPETEDARWWKAAQAIRLDQFRLIYPTVSDLDEPIASVSTKWFPFTFVDSGFGFGLCKLRSSLSARDDGYFAICALVVSAKLFDRNSLQACSYSHGFHRIILTPTMLISKSGQQPYMRDINDEQILLIMTIMELLDKPTQPHQIRIAYYNADQKLQHYKSLPASRKSVTEV